MKPIILIDPGHGGINPESGEYVTALTRSPKRFGPQLFEGVYARDIAQRLGQLCAFHSIPFRFIVEPVEWQDPKVNERIERANSFFKKNQNCILLSIHTKGYANNRGTGLEVHSHKANDKAVRLAKLFLQETCTVLPELKNNGASLSNHTLLQFAAMPSVLIELGNFLNEADYNSMSQDDFRQRAAIGLFNAIVKL